MFRQALQRVPPSPLVLLPTAWCLRNEGVSSVLLGASNAEQLMENIGAIQVRFGTLLGAQVAPAFLETQLHWTPFQEYRAYRDGSEPCLCRAGPHRIRHKRCEWVCRGSHDREPRGQSRQGCRMQGAEALETRGPSKERGPLNKLRKAPKERRAVWVTGGQRTWSRGERLGAEMAV